MKTFGGWKYFLISTFWKRLDFAEEAGRVFAGSSEELSEVLYSSFESESYNFEPKSNGG
jgi:hypothetical protein